MKKTENKQYPTEFKASAIKLALESDQPVSHTAKDLGISSSTLHTQHRKDDGSWNEEVSEKAKSGVNWCANASNWPSVSGTFTKRRAARSADSTSLRNSSSASVSLISLKDSPERTKCP